MMRTGLIVVMMLLAIGCASPDGKTIDDHDSFGGVPAVAARGASFDIKSRDGRYHLRAQLVERDTLPASEPFDMVVRVVDGPPMAEIRLSFDAAMPHHGHGMNVVPVTTKQADGSFLVEGILLHMGGRWELYFDVDEGGITERVQHVVMIE